MGSHITESITTVLLAIVGVAVLAIILSKKSNTSGVVQSLASGFGNSLAVAESPVTGTSLNVNLNYPGNASYGYGVSGFGPANNYSTF